MSGARSQPLLTGGSSLPRRLQAQAAQAAAQAAVAAGADAAGGAAPAAPLDAKQQAAEAAKELVTSMVRSLGLFPSSAVRLQMPFASPSNRDYVLMTGRDARLPAQLGPRPELAAHQQREIKGGGLSSAMGAAGRVLQKPKARSASANEHPRLPATPAGCEARRGGRLRELFLPSPRSRVMTRRRRVPPRGGSSTRRAGTTTTWTPRCTSTRGASACRGRPANVGGRWFLVFLQDASLELLLLLLPWRGPPCRTKMYFNCRTGEWMASLQARGVSLQSLSTPWRIAKIVVLPSVQGGQCVGGPSAASRLASTKARATLINPRAGEQRGGRCRPGGRGGGEAAAAARCRQVRAVIAAQAGAALACG